MDIIDRIKQYLNHKGISDYRFEKTLSLSKGYINKAKNPTADILMKMCGIYTDISTEWLLRGEGEMLREKREDLGLHRAESASTDENSLIYKMYKEKDDENKTLIKQNAVLEERIRQLEADNESLRSQSGADRIRYFFRSTISRLRRRLSARRTSFKFQTSVSRKSVTFLWVIIERLSKGND